MDYAAAFAKERLSGRGFFAATATPTQFTDIGNVVMFKLAFDIDRKQHFSSRRGIRFLDRDDAIGHKAKWTVEIDEYATPLLPILWAGTANANFSQSSATAATFAFTSKKGFAFDVGKYGLFDASLTTPGSKVEGANQGAGDYWIDRAGGKIYIPLGSTIADSTACTLTYSAPALTYDSVTALNVLNRPGNFELHGEDDSAAGIGSGAGAVAPVRYLFNFPCILSNDDSGDFKVDDYRSSRLILTPTAPMTVKRLQV